MSNRGQRRGRRRAAPQPEVDLAGAEWQVAGVIAGEMVLLHLRDPRGGGIAPGHAREYERVWGLMVRQRHTARVVSFLLELIRRLAEELSERQGEEAWATIERVLSYGFDRTEGPPVTAD